MGPRDETDQNVLEDVALVTGAGGGIGRATALALSAAGVKVAALDLSEEGVQETARLVRANGGTVSVEVGDVASRSELIEAMDRTEADLGPLTIAVNAHGVGPTSAFLDVDDAQWDRVLSVNLTGTLLVGQEAGRRMVKHAYGRIVNLSSLSPTFPSSGFTSYMVSKGGVEALTRAMAFELGPSGITVNTVAPGPILTDLMRGMLTDEARAARLERMPVGRLGEPEDVADAIVYLASRNAGYVSGTVLTVDGGYSVAGIRTPTSRLVPDTSSATSGATR